MAKFNIQMMNGYVENTQETKINLEERKRLKEKINNGMMEHTTGEDILDGTMLIDKRLENNRPDLNHVQKTAIHDSSQTLW